MSADTTPAAPPIRPPIRDAAEMLSRDELAAVQLERLRATIGRILAAQPLGAERLRQAGITAPRTWWTSAT